MDPEANLKEMLELAASLITWADSDEVGEHIDEDDAVRLAELVQALNEWIMKGGFLPRPWSATLENLRREAALRGFVDTVDATGGVVRTELGHAPVGDPEWYDLGAVYAQACEALGLPVRVGGGGAGPAPGRRSGD